MLTEHLKKFAKAYAAGATVLVVGSVAQDVTTVLVWLIGLIHVTVPAIVQTALANIITAIAGGGAAGLTTNTSTGGLELPSK